MSEEEIEKLRVTEMRDPNPLRHALTKHAIQLGGAINQGHLAAVRARLQQNHPKYRQGWFHVLSVVSKEPLAFGVPENLRVRLEAVEGSTIVVSKKGEDVDRPHIAGFLDRSDLSAPADMTQFIGRDPAEITEEDRRRVQSMFDVAAATYDPSTDRTTYRIEVAKVTEQLDGILNFRFPLPT
jgi:hypothetical protein